MCFLYIFFTQALSQQSQIINSYAQLVDFNVPVRIIKTSPNGNSIGHIQFLQMKFLKFQIAPDWRKGVFVCPSFLLLKMFSSVRQVFLSDFV